MLSPSPPVEDRFGHATLFRDNQELQQRTSSLFIFFGRRSTWGWGKAWQRIELPHVPSRYPYKTE